MIVNKVLTKDYRKYSPRRATRDKRILVIRSKVGSSELLDGLADAGASVEMVVAYKNIDIEPEKTDFDVIDRILFTSGSTIRAFLRRYGSVPAGTKVHCLGQPTLHEARKHNIEAKPLAWENAIMNQREAR